MMLIFKPWIFIVRLTDVHLNIELIFHFFFLWILVRNLAVASIAGHLKYLHRILINQDALE
jgi:hypothetical protein